MKSIIKYSVCLLWLMLFSCTEKHTTAKAYFKPTKETSKPWVYWYWMQSAYSKEGITADLEAMKAAGIKGAYLMSIKGPADPPLIDPPILQLSKEWWDLVGFAIKEADRLGLQIAMHAADGFAVAGGPWITPEQSMQKVVWKDTLVAGGQPLNITLPQPETYEGYYKDIATFAIPVTSKPITSAMVLPKVTSTVANFDASFLSDTTKDGNFKLYEPGWVQYEFATSFECKSLTVTTKGNNYQAHRILIKVSDDGVNFTSLGRLTAPRQGWQDTDANYTHAITPVKAKYFRFEYDPEGTEPGAEDLDAAKWKQSFKVSKLILSNQSIIDNYEGKSGLVWRVSPETTSAQIPQANCIPLQAIVNVSDKVKEGILHWEAPEGNWQIVRFGHTSTGHENATGGAGKGLEVDKFNPEAIRFQFDKWYGESARVAGPELTGKVLSILHIDSWECGSQNWSPVFREEFEKRRGYDVLPYLPVMAGIPVADVTTTEQVLYDVRKTIAELIADNFFGTVAAEAKKLGVQFSSENVSPTMVSDALLHFDKVDYPGGEFWLKSPTHDKPNDMLDAISGGHIYGKDIIQAEAFTELRMDWDEHPGNLKAMADRNYALGINRFFYHVFVHNPWVDRKPGMTLDGVGSYFQRDQTWWEPGKAWVAYCDKVQYQLQKGIPVVDIAVFTGEELPSRSVLPDRLVPFMPGIFGEVKVAQEKERLKNEGQPTAKMPKEVTYSKNLTDLSEWVNALNGYKYDSFNPDALLKYGKVKNGKVYFKGDISYSVLVFPDTRKMSPNTMMSVEVAEKLVALVNEGATIMVGTKPDRIPGLQADKEKWQQLINTLWAGSAKATAHDGVTSWTLGKGKVIQLPYMPEDLTEIGVQPDIVFPDLPRAQASMFAWNHRETAGEEIYFISNQTMEHKQTKVSFSVSGSTPYVYDPVLDVTTPVVNFAVADGRTSMVLQFEANQSLFVIFKEEFKGESKNKGNNWLQFTKVQQLDEQWHLQFDPAYHGPKEILKTDHLFDWSTSDNDSIKYYSGTTLYTKTFEYQGDVKDLWLSLGEVANMAEVTLNGKACGVVWTYPYRIPIGEAIQKGKNTLVIKVTNTWANRLIGDQVLPEEQRLTWTTAPYRLQDTELLKAGLLGPVQLLKAE